VKRMADKIVISLVSVMDNPKSKRTRRAMAKVRLTLAKKYHVEPDKVVISQKINHAIFERGIEKIPRKVSMMVQLDDGIPKAFFAGEKIPEKKKDAKKEKKEKPKEEKKPVETEDEIEQEKKTKEKREREFAAEKSAIKMKSGR